MKFRDLKKKKWFIYFDDFTNDQGTHYNAYLCKDKGLYAHAEWEEDNGLYTVTGIYGFQFSWKDLKYNMTHYRKRWQKENRMPYHVRIYTGKCSKCGKEISFQEACDNWNWCSDCNFKLWADIADE